MPNYFELTRARELLAGLVEAVGTEELPLSECSGRVLARELRAKEDVPPFDRSPYDGYAFRGEDTQSASAQSPVTLRLLEEVPAGAVPTKPVVPGTATKILTGAPIPEGANVVCKYEETEFTGETVKLFKPYRCGDNIVKAGEDMLAGTVLARLGDTIDAGTAGTLASQNTARPLVYKKPRIGILSTGDELVELDSPLTAGKIHNSNLYSLQAALRREGMTPVYLGLGGDSVDAISALIEKGLRECDAVISTGGVSVGDYDLTPASMEKAGVELLFRGVRIQPGSACAYGIKDGKLYCGLPGNPAAAIVNFSAVALPALRKLTGRADYMPAEIMVTLKNEFKKKSAGLRLLRGILDLSDGTARIQLPPEQRSSALSSMIGCGVIAFVPPGSGPLPAGTVLKGFLI